MSGPLAEANAAIRALWDADWSPTVTGAVVRWAENRNDLIPTADAWLHLEIEFSNGGDIIAFGGGRAQNERELLGHVLVMVMTKRGKGEANQLSLLDDALAVFRSKRVGALSFVGDTPIAAGSPSADGLWWVRSGLASFTYRFRG